MNDFYNVCVCYSLEKSSEEEGSSVLTTVKASSKNLKTDYYKSNRYALKTWDKRIKTPLLALFQSYSFHNLSGFFVQYDEWRPTFESLNHDAYGVPSSSFGFLADFSNLRFSSNSLLLCQSFNVTKEWRELPHPINNQGFESILLAFEPSMPNMSANYQLICVVPSFGVQIVCFELYSSETNIWNQCNTICLELGDDTEFTGNEFYMKGMVHWKTISKQVAAFDMKNESYQITSLPPKTPQMHEYDAYY